MESFKAFRIHADKEGTRAGFEQLNLDDLTEGERAYLQREATSMCAEITRLTGCPVERRREGLALIDAGLGFTDRRFPATSSAGQCALLIIDRIAARLEEGPPVEQVRWPSLRELGLRLADELDACLPEGLIVDTREPPPTQELPPAYPSPFLPRSWLTDAAEEIQAELGEVLKADLRGDPELLVDEVQ